MASFWRGSAFRKDAANPHFSPGGVIMAPEFFPQGVLASEERSGHYGQASMCALRGKGQARARPAQSVPRRLQTKRPKMLKTSTFRHFAQRPGEKCGLSRRLRGSGSATPPQPGALRRREGGHRGNGRPFSSTWRLPRSGRAGPGPRPDRSFPN